MIKNEIKDDNLHIFNNKYIEIKTLGEGTFGIVYLVKEKSTNKIYAIKESKKEEDKSFDNEIKILNSLKDNNVNNQYIIKKIEDWEEEQNKIIKKYIVLDYIPNGTLLRFFNYFSVTKKGFKEKYIKLIFSKILEGVQAMHNVGICHLDLKLNNILLDDNYNSIICDFSIAAILNKGLNCFEKLQMYIGSNGYKSPEILREVSYDGIKADIFSLGVILFKLITYKKIFRTYNKNKKSYDRLYKYIINKDSKSYWKIIEVENNNLNISELFKNLFFKIVTLDPEKRPSINDIYNDPWMEEINKLTKEEKDKLEKELYEEFKKIDKLIKEYNCEIDSKSEKEKIIHRESNKSGTNTDVIYFSEDLELDYINEDIIDKENYIKINGYLNPKNFMNSFANKIKEINDCTIEESKDNYEFNIIIQKEDDDEEIPEDLEDELFKLGIEDAKDYMNYINKNDLIIQIKLFKSQNGYLIRILKKEGEMEDFYDIFEKIIPIAKDLFN